MKFWDEIICNKVLLAAILGWVVAQVLKVVYILLTERKLDISRIVGSGGMPSSHSAFVGAMTTSVGLAEGFDSTLFAIAFVLSFIVMYDASGVRKAAGEQAKVINDLQEMLHDEVPVYLKELLGHTVLEVIVGCILGIAIGLLMFL
ncbi:MAG: divergent PAP2 family protein [Clostridia bacterium]|nr:divergent PAP2 family protein [Clostridia bacterium]